MNSKFSPAAGRCELSVQSHNSALHKGPFLGSRSTRGYVVVQARKRESQPFGFLSRFNPDVKGILSVSAVVFILANSISEAQAEERVWKPRRHHRRLGDGPYPDTWADAIVEAEYLERERTREQRAKEQELKRKASEEAARLRLQREAELEAQRQKTIAESTAAPDAALVALRGRPPPFTIFGVEPQFVFLFAAIAGLLALGYRAGTSRDRRSGGKWVLDRSLGGKRVWVPDAASTIPADPSTAASTSSTAPASSPLSSTPRISKISEDDFVALTSLASMAASAASAAADLAPTASSTWPASSKAVSSSVDEGLPAWWDAPPILYVPPERKASLQNAANKYLRQLEDIKNQGRDYSPSLMRELHEACVEGCVSVKPRTPGGRDNLFRTAVEMAAHWAAAPSASSSMICDEAPCRWVAAFAGHLGMDDERALKITRALVATNLRNTMLDAVAALKSNNQPELLNKLARLAALVERLPVLEACSYEVSIIASNLTKRISEKEREALVVLCNQVLPSATPFVAALMGYDPSSITSSQPAA